MIGGTNWNKRFIELAEHVAQWSRDPSTKVGAVIVNPDNRRIVSVGYNGFPEYVLDTAERYNNRPTKYALVVHAELNAILTAKKDLTGHWLYVTLSPCRECAKAIIQCGIKQVYYKELRTDIYTNIMFKESGISMEQVK
jgi:dCMP deaminase